ncbi:hypothetical protein DICA2_E13454 [Diutina catenulata]
MSSEVPEELQNNKNVAPYLARARELAEANPVVSYYCLIYVLEYILSHKLHTESKAVETYTVQLLDDTESAKNSDELKEVLDNKQLCVTAVASFAYKLFNQCVSAAAPANKQAAIAKIRATINFLTVLSVFTANEGIDWAKVSGGTATTGEEFEQLNNKKIKVLKVQLVKVIKSQDTDLEAELDELAPEGKGLSEEPPEEEAPVLPEPPKFIDDDTPSLPSAPSALDDEPSLSLPGAPRTNPDDDSEIGLPSAPHYLPDDDLSGITKSSAISVIHPDDHKEPAPGPVPRRTSFVPKSDAVPVTKETVSEIMNRTDAIAQVQKHAKFAISALNYEDVDTATKELQQALAKLASISE